MKYILILWENHEIWIEIDDEKYALRQICKEPNGDIEISCFDDCLAEGIIEEEDLEGQIIKVSKEDFEKQWKSLTKDYLDNWKKIKEKYFIGSQITGKCKYFYPQGAIIECQDCTALYDDIFKVDVNQEVKGTVCGYDEDNMWIKIDID
ncbi:MAG: hypothetical protein ACI3VR_09655 [Intestinibacter sp.]|uniref:hypothetical protein n=1 Tax=Intestinibacter sp. TaxID=1965304 RepID=UPI003F159BEA